MSTLRREQHRLEFQTQRILRQQRARPSLRVRGVHQPGHKIKGEVTGKEDLFIDGVLEGKLE